MEADKADWAVIYYAGHGIEVGGLNYVIPVDASLRADRDVSDEAIPLERIMTSLQRTRKLKLVIFDACRDNPFLNKMQRVLGVLLGRSAGIGRCRARWRADSWSRLQRRDRRLLTVQ